MVSRPATLFALAGAMVAAGPCARANGRFPAANFLAVRPLGDHDALVLQTTFGIASSTDGGRRWRWTCEPALGFNSEFDPVIAFADDGAEVFALPDGLTRSADDACTFAVPPGAPTATVKDLAADATGREIVAGTTSLSDTNALARSDDGGRTWHAAGTIPRLSIETVDVAPDHPERVYVSGYLPGSIAIVYASDDHGDTFHETTRDLHGGYSVFLSGVVAGARDTVFVRTDVFDGGTLLLRSDDGARTFRQITRTSTRMTGFAIGTSADDLWVAGATLDEGLRHTTDGGTTWTRFDLRIHTRCVRTSGRRVYVCANETQDGYSLAMSDDGVAPFSVIFAHDQLGPPLDCPVGTSVRDRCAPLWPATAARFVDAGGAPVDAGAVPPDASLDATVRDGDRTTLDGARGDAGDAFVPPVGRGCACATGPQPVRPAGVGAVAWFLAAVCATRVRRRT